MPDSAALQAAAGVAAVIIALGGVALALQRLGIVRTGPALRVAPAGRTDERLDEIESELRAQSARIADIEHRLDRGGVAIDTLRAEVISVGQTAARIEGEIKGLSGQLGIVTEHLLAGRRSADS